ncbi:MAG: hypothetical protein CVU50_08810 [Candidatus Cloacimonetes bacterium HGW-Cloacimonetes-3]|nr:MAG: hypothetical protein CVU50_08810 [Candidatus Cloacimonetes bacterium HGW-Cloacimonetes-3]
MQIKSVKLLSVILMMLTIMLVLAGCGKSGNRLGNQAPEIKITSFEGWDSTYVSAGYDTTLVYSFHQRVYWHAWDKDGTIAGYAFRVLDENNDPIVTPGYEYLATAVDNLIPQNLLDLDPKGGWVIHYLPGEDQSKPLDDSATRRTIWTSDKYAVINFPAADVNGEPLNRASRFEVVAIDNRGAITPDVAWRNFTTTSNRPTCTLSTTKGKPYGGSVGAGLKLSFAMNDTDPFLPITPFRYQFQMMKTDLLGNVITPPESLVWIDTKTQTVEPGTMLTIGEFLINITSNPPLKYDYDANGNQVSLTKVIARATDMAGIVSVPDTNSVIRFRVKKGFSPKSLIYGPKTYAMGDYHYEDWGDSSTPEVLPTQYAQGGQRWATPLFKDLDDKYTAVYSNNLKLWIRWGWLGEYYNEGNVPYDENVPYGKKVDVVVDRATGVNYFSEITYFHVRYDNDYYKFPPYDHLKIQDANGDWWLRIPVGSVIGQSILLTGFPVPPDDMPGEHVFQIACEDLQGIVDPIPAEFRFYLHKLIPPSARSGILVIDDDLPQDNYSPQVAVQSFYESLFSEYTGTIRFVNQSYPKAQPLPIMFDTFSDARKRQIAFSELQKYKLVVYHNDNPAKMGGFIDIADALTLYMLNGGNLVVSHSSQIKSMMDALSPTGSRSTLKNYMGFVDSPSEIQNLGSSVTNNPFFNNAVANATGFADVALNVTNNYFSLVNVRKGLGSVAYFPDALAETVFYKLGLKAVGSATFPPTQAQYDTYINKPVGIRLLNGTGGRSYTLGFPLSYMDSVDAKAMMTQIRSECGL